MAKFFSALSAVEMLPLCFDVRAGGAFGSGFGPGFEDVFGDSQKFVPVLEVVGERKKAQVLILSGSAALCFSCKNIWSLPLFSYCQQASGGSRLH